MVLLVDHDGALELDDRYTVLVVAGGIYHHDADVRARARLALLQDLAPGVDRIPLEDRRRQPYLVPAEVGEDVLGDVGDALARDQRQREGRVNERPAKLRLGRVSVIYVDGSRVLGEEREPHVIGGRHGTHKWVLVQIPNLEAFDESS